MGLEQAREAMESAKIETPVAGDSGVQDVAASNGDLAPDSDGGSSQILDLSKAEKFLWEGKEMTPDDLRKNFLRQQDYTKKTQAIAEDKRRFEEERLNFIRSQEENEKFESNLDADIANVLRDPSLKEQFMKIYPEKYHRILDQVMSRTFGEQDSQQRNDSVLEQRLKAIENKFMSQDQERSAKAFETEVSKNSEILDSAISRFASKYPSADEDSVLARAEHAAMFIKKDENFNSNFSQVLEKLYKENHAFHENRYKEMYKQQVERQKQANSKGRDIGRGGQTPGTAPVKLKLKDVKNHILENL